MGRCLGKCSLAHTIVYVDNKLTVITLAPSHFNIGGERSVSLVLPFQGMVKRDNWIRLTRFNRIFLTRLPTNDHLRWQ